MHKEEYTLRKLIEEVYFDPDLFKIFVAEDKYLFGYMSSHSEGSAFFEYKTIYDTIVDLHLKIKKSFDLALEWEYKTDIDQFNMVAPPTKEEDEAIYYTENAVFRLSALWDMLAQLYNIKFKKGKSPEKVYYAQLFHDDTQGKKPNAFAQKVYAYLKEQDNPHYDYKENEFWKGNHAYIVEYRDKMTHRNSPNVATLSNFAVELRMPMRYVLKRAIEDYVQATRFIIELLPEIVKDFQTD